ncbi:IS66 family insertion sequence element accessory protein TnpB [Vibrio navarrensis]|uniref:IS66 family insertion sequence element accessory protein TnpB n=1 Tax=Vibrio navarrensis TaxID=29495 RepID=UPI0015584C42
MLSLTSIYTALVEFRKGINGLSLIVEQHMHLNPFSEALFVFCNRPRDKLRARYWRFA